MVGKGSGDDVAAIERAMVGLRRSQARRTLARLSRRRGRSGSHAGLPDAVFEVLDTVAASPAALTVTEIAIALGVDQPRASRLTGQALEVGLLRRDADQADGRRSLLALTPEGQDAMDQIQAFRQDVVTQAIGHWAASDRKALASLLTRFVDDLASTTDR